MQILYFAGLREMLGKDGETVELPSDARSPLQLIHWLQRRDPVYAAAFGDLEKIKCAVDQTITGLEVPFEEATEIAFFPPVTGG